VNLVVRSTRVPIAVLAVSVDIEWVSLVLLVEIATVWFTLHAARARPRVIRLAGVLMVLAGIGAVAGVANPERARPVVFALAALLYSIAPFAIIRHLAKRPGVDQETMIGAIAAYLLFGMFFAFLYRFIGEVQASGFFGADVGDGTMTQTLFFSFTTLTTTGYGNLVPAGNPGQTFSMSEMIVGQLFLITAMGKIVTEWKPRSWRPGGNDPPS
jgi:hypothetical protein